MLSHKLNKTTPRIEHYQKEIHQLLRPRNALIFDPENILADLLKNYLSLHPLENAFALRLSNRLTCHDFNLLAELNQYLANKENPLGLRFAGTCGKKTNQIDEFDALIIAYFYYYGDYYLYECGQNILSKYSNLNKYLFQPLTQYRAAKQHQQFQQLMQNACSDNNTIYSTPTVILRDDSQIPTKMIPVLIETLIQCMENNPSKPHYNRLSQLLICKHFDGHAWYTAMSLRFPLTLAQRARLVKTLLTYALVSFTSELLDEILLFAPKEDWQTIFVTIMQGAKCYPSHLEWMLKRLDGSENEVIVNLIIEKLKSFLSDMDQYTRICAHSALFNNKCVNKRYHLSIVNKLLAGKTDTTDNNPQTQIKNFILHGLESKDFDVFASITILADELSQYTEIAQALLLHIKALLQSPTGSLQRDIGTALTALTCLNLDKPTRASVITEILEQVPFSIITQERHGISTALNNLCKTEDDFLQLFQYIRTHFVNPDIRTFEKISAILFFASVKFTPKLTEQIVAMIISSLENPALWQATAMALHYLPPSSQYSSYIIQRMLSELTRIANFHREEACAVILHYYPISENKTEIVTALLACIRDDGLAIKQAAFTTLAALPNLTLNANQLESDINSLKTCTNAWLFFQKIHITNVSHSFLDQMINVATVVNNVDVFNKILLNVTPPSMLPYIAEKLTRLALANPSNELYYHSLTFLSVPMEDTLALLNHLLDIPLFRYTIHHAALFEHLLENLSYAAKLSAIIALEAKLVVSDFHYAENKIMIDKLKNQYLNTPLLVKSLHFNNPEIASLPEELLEKVHRFTK